MKSRAIQSFLYSIGALSVIGCFVIGFIEFGKKEDSFGLVIWILIGLLVFALLLAIGNIVVVLEYRNHIAAEHNMILKQMNENLNEIRKSLKHSKKED